MINEERRRPLLYALFTASLCIAAIVCAVLGYFVLAPGTKLVRLGPEAKFSAAADRPVDIAVNRLETSKLIPNRPSLSDDVIFVVRDTGGFRAFLGTDPENGCFLNWNQDQQVYIDNCERHTYGFTGRNTNQLATTTTQPINMVELPVTVRDGVLFAEDRILRRDLR